MKPLVLTGWLIHEFIDTNFADLAVHFPFRFVWGQLPSQDELAAYLGPGTPDHGPGSHWSDFAFRWDRSKSRDDRDLGWSSSVNAMKPSNCGSTRVRMLNCS